MLKLLTKALVQNFRYPSSKGQITTEDLFSLPLISDTGFDLDSVAMELHAKLEKLPKISFVKNAMRGTVSTKLADCLEVVKYVISIKEEQAEAALKEATKVKRNEKLNELIARKQDDEMANLSLEELIALRDA